MKQDIHITILVENTASQPDFLAEHGLSFWIQYGSKRVLFDTGQSEILIHNAKISGIDLSTADAVILSHGHYDHTGGLSAVLDIAKKAVLYVHPEALSPKFSRKGGDIRMIGMPRCAAEKIQTLAGAGRVVWTQDPTQVFPNLSITGQIPRNTDFEDVGGAFYLDETCRSKDRLPDDQALFLNSNNGPIVVLGCAHSGVANTLSYVAKLNAQKRIYAVLGGMHLLNASNKRIEQTAEILRDYGVQKIGLAHCTGINATRQLLNLFPERCFTCPVGTRIDL